MSKVRNLINEQAIIKMRELARRAGTGFLQTMPGELPCKGRPMKPAHVDDEGRFWFFSQASSNKNADIKHNSMVQLIFANPKDEEFLCISGQAEIIFDRNKTDEYWSAEFRAWFPKGKEDPDISLLCVKPSRAHYWDRAGNKAVALLKNKVGSLVGIAVDNNIEGALRI